MKDSQKTEMENQSLDEPIVMTKDDLKKKAKHKSKKEKPSKKESTENPEDSFLWIQDNFPVEDIFDGVAKMKDGRYVMFVEINPINFKMRSNAERNAIVDTFKSWLKIAPAKMQFKSITEQTDTIRFIQNVYNSTSREDNKKIRLARQDYTRHITSLNQKEALKRKYLIAFEYDGKNTDKQEVIISRLHNFKNMMVRFFSSMGNFIVTHDDENVFMLETLYNLMNRKSAKKENANQRFCRVVSDEMKINGLTYGIDEAPPGIPIATIMCPRGMDFTHSNYNIIDGVYSTYLYIKKDSYPFEVYAAWLDGIIQAGEGIDIDVFALKKDRLATIQMLSRTIRVKKANSRGKEDSEEYGETLEDIAANRFIRDMMKNEKEDLYVVFTMITISAPSLELMNQRKNDFIEILKADDILVSPTINRCEDAFYMSLPLLCINKSLFNKGKRNFLTSSLAGTYMFTAFENYNENGTLLGINTANSSLAAIDIFDTQQYKNGNFAILGTTGAGKTFTLQMLARHLRLSSINVMMILPVKGYEQYRSCMDVSGEFIKMAPMAKTCVNIMEIRPQDSAEISLIEGDDTVNSCLLTNKISQLTIFMQLLLRDERMTNVEETMLNAVLTTMYNEFGITSDNNSVWANDMHTFVKPMPIIEDWYNAMEGNEDLVRIQKMLIPFINGTCSNMNGQTNVNLANKYIVFDVSEAGDNLLPAFMFIALDCCYDKVKSSRLQKDVILLDELWKMMINERTAKYVLELAKVIRGYVGALGIATQDIDDLLGFMDGKYGNGIINACKLKCVLQLEEDATYRLSKILKLSAQDRKDICKFEPGQCIWISNGDKMPVLMRASEHEQEIFSTDAKTYRKIAEKNRAFLENDEEKKQKIREQEKQKEYLQAKSHNKDMV